MVRPAFNKSDASCPYNFFITGDTKNPARNRLSSSIKPDLNHQHAVDGSHGKRIRRSFGLAPFASDHDPSGGRLELEHGHPSCIPDDINHGYHPFRANLLQDLTSDYDAEQSEMNFARSLPSRSPQGVSLQGKRARDIFNLTRDSMWIQGERNLRNLDLDGSLETVAGWNVSGDTSSACS
ncbi:uncharacterized protein EI90DRAFT_3075715 [Cantharellus anzutake]|uniref:uncharacterized protein n=1 Tax=Cantharellus anzutake TaxID=1750568 RepID=UPI00190539E9|nr:uncharacterized protein EI90DRAFT_3075715 [Cantharellus anzutake]KAF8324291.1 hypothetical protein EI90DRAFT_3075715 [Cantharellus anzutake]